MKLFSTLFFLFYAVICQGQLLSTNPVFVRESSSTIEISMDANFGNQGLKDHTPTSDVYVHIGLITNLSTSPTDWKYSKFTWGQATPAAQATYVSPNKWRFTITGGLRSFFGVTNQNEVIQKIVILFRSGTGAKAQRNRDGTDMYIPVYDNNLQVRVTQPFRQPTFNPIAEPLNLVIGNSLTISGASSDAAQLKLLFNGTEVANAANATTVSANVTITTTGTQTVIAEATVGTTVKRDTVTFFVTPTTVVEPLPAGVRNGINYESGDTSVTLVLFAPGKNSVAVIGEFNNWAPTVQHQMKKTPDGNRFWVRITGLTPAREYAYQFLIDGTLKVADMYAEKVLDPWNDQYIPAASYPNLKPYPAGQSGVVSVLQTAKPTFNWQVQNFARPDKRNLIIYELLVRDFVATQNWNTLRDTLGYLKRLGINTINIMPFNEFEGNISWGYNPSYFFAPDKIYGTETALRQFIDECHKEGIAVVMDIALNHAFGMSPTVQMYWNAALNRPSADNPWHNEEARHPFNVGFDFNHESQATRTLVDRVVEHWLTNYKIDGFRWDLSKGFTQVNSGSNVAQWGNYDASRIAIWKRIYDKMMATSANSYCILEHFADNSEETELANYGMLLWGNLNHNFSEAAMGHLAQSNFQWGIHTARNWTRPHLITYQESHDEERLMYRNLNFGNTNNPAHNVRDLNVALKRNELTTSFWSMIPAPKMMWQFGELGYDFSINYCQNGTVNDNCRTDPKPIRWDYLGNPNRKALHDHYARMLRLRNIPNFLPTWVTNNVSYNLAGAFKWLQVNSDSLRVTVIGNFDVVPATGNITFQSPGIWYNYTGGGTRNATGGTESITLQPGEYAVYLNRDVNNLVTTPVRNVAATALNMRMSIYPNPVNKFAVIDYDLPESGNVTVSVLNMTGQQLATLYTGFKARGTQKLPINSNGFNPSRLATGMYLLKIEVNGKMKVQQFQVIN
ncbi:alpha-amylase family glycosyl hydrolase [Aridibaculum aurantiacum]|uniref:alpha-amylase family glycosyl hydrolase n=1 Tax=Aridibaculum aurantiacum TaxID=2810307 RepID=UPI001A973966|nr:alpha-amylase family glycosyl hydrolase [Aridibaculum aurantiacum]